MSWSALRLMSCRGKLSRAALSFSSRETMLSSLRIKGLIGLREASMARSSCCKAGAHASLGHRRLMAIADDGYSISHVDRSVADPCYGPTFHARHCQAQPPHI